MNSHVVTPDTEAAILSRMLTQSGDMELSPDAARYLLSLKLPPSDEDRVNELSAKARAGLLNDSERQELESICTLEACFAGLQSKPGGFLSIPRRASSEALAVGSYSPPSAPPL